MTKDYIKEHGDFLARGTTRELYMLNGKVYKIASEPENLENNKAEFSRYTMLPEHLREFVPTISLVNEDDYEILEVEYVIPLEKWLDEKGHMKLADFLYECMDDREIDDLCKQLNLEFEVSHELIYFLIDCGCTAMELYYPANYGVKGDKLVLLDFADYHEMIYKNEEMSEMMIF